MGCGSGGCGKNGDCSTGGCNRLNVYDWLENMLPANTAENENIYEVRFKGTRKWFYRNLNSLDLTTGDYVTVESDRGYDVGVVSMGGELTRLQMKKKKIPNQEVLKIYRLANQADMDKYSDAKAKEYDALVLGRKIIQEHKVDMKLTDVEFQADGSKAIFYYTAEQRIDFRELIKVYAEEFKIRVEMRQIGLRQEAGLLGGIGSCGRELCCSTWLTDFQNVSTASARYQNISLNPMKITGQCGRLKCCLNYELEVYLDALKDIPKVIQLETELGSAILQKTDIFKKIMWFSYAQDETWVGLTVTSVISIQKMNQKGIKPPTLQINDTKLLPKPEKEKENLHFADVVGQSTLNIDKKKNNNNPNKKKNNHNNNNSNPNPNQNPNNKPKNPNNKKKE